MRTLTQGALSVRYKGNLWYSETKLVASYSLHSLTVDERVGGACDSEPRLVGFKSGHTLIANNLTKCSLNREQRTSRSSVTC